MDEYRPPFMGPLRRTHSLVVDAINALPLNLREVAVKYFLEEVTLDELCLETGRAYSDLEADRAEALVRLRTSVENSL